VIIPDRIPMEIVIVDRPGGRAGWARAGAAHPELPRFAGDLEWLRWRVTAVRRLDPRATGMAFADLPAARAAVEEEGTEALPLVLADGVVVHSGSYPSRAKLQAIIAGGRAGPELDESDETDEAPR
jgi:hypothetical protein